MKPDTLDRIAGNRVIGVVRASSAAHAVATAELMIDAGLWTVEITMTVPDGLRALETVAAGRDDRLVGAGTVLDADIARAAIDAGARFIVSPALIDDVVETAVRLGVVVVPGTLTPTEMVRATALGADAVKLFPASAVGPGYLRAIRAALPELRVIPTGGVDAASAPDWFAAGAIAVGVGGSIATGEPATARRAIAALLRACGAPGSG